MVWTRVVLVEIRKNGQVQAILEVEVTRFGNWLDLGGREIATDMAEIIDVSRVDCNFLAWVNGSIEKPIPKTDTAGGGVVLGKKVINWS